MMNIPNNKIENSYITNRTTLPLFTERYDYLSHKRESLHLHDFFEIGIVLTGSLTHHTESGTEDLSEGAVYFIPIGFSHSLESATVFSLQNIYLLPRILFQNIAQNESKLFPSLLHEFLLFCTNHFANRITTLSLTKEELHSVHLLVETYHLAQLTEPLKNSFCYHCLINVLIILCNAFYRYYPEILVRKDERIYQILGEIDKHLYFTTREIIQTISASLSLNPQYINKLIKKELLTTFSNLILDIKIEKGCELLLQNISITEVATILGFYDHSHFNKYFIRKLGITPFDYQSKNNMFFLNKC